MRGNVQRHDTLVSRLRFHVDRVPEKEVYRVVDRGTRPDSVASYGDLWRKSASLAALLQELGAAGGRALIMLPQSLDYMIAFFACQLAGVTAVTLYPPQTRSLARFSAVIDDCDAACAFVTSSDLDLVEPMMEQYPALRRVRWIAVDDLDLEDGAEPEPAQVTPETIAFLQYTSGSTSAPKGVMVTHGNVTAHAALLASMSHMDAASVIVAWMPLFHDFALIGKALQTVMLGARAVLMSPTTFVARPARWLQTITVHQGTHSGGPNFAYQACVERIEDAALADVDLSSWRVAWNGAEPVRGSTLAAFSSRFAGFGFRARSLAPSYGLAEATLFVSADAGAEGRWRSVVVDREALARGEVAPTPAGAGIEIVSCGPPITEVRIVDPETTRPSAPTSVGEIWVAGETVARGYWGRPDETERTFRARVGGEEDSAPYLRTGDLGFVRDGDLYIVGRLKDVIIVRGSNYHPQDIELTTERLHVAFRAGHGAAFAVGENNDELVVVQEVLRGQASSLDEDALFAQARRRIWEEHGLTLSTLVLLRRGGVRKTSSGKIQRSANRSAFLDGSLDAIAVLSQDGRTWPGQALSAPSAAPEEEPHA